ncbi:MAG: hypothetical protein UY14_C0011G0012 [Parcubacteria group bacterium GW2011_GWA1_47_9]|nr:MAG: hypothetical protein UY14_C0011G0012 [Parcubacteria group bacterium GW2011_GWA1_47_9]
MLSEIIPTKRRKERRDKLDEIAHRLIEKETIERDEFAQIVGMA